MTKKEITSKAFLSLMIGLIVTIAIQGCSTNVDLTEPQPEVEVIDEEVEEESPQEDIQTENESNNEELIEQITKNAPTFDRESLIQKIKNITGREDYRFNIDSDNPEYFPANQRKQYVIHSPKSESTIDSFEEFCAKYCAFNWDGIYYFINESSFYGYFPERTITDFDSKREYDDYKKNMILVNHTREEQSIKREQGYVLEYRLFASEVDILGNFYGNIVDYQLIYKVPCSENFTVIIRPNPAKYTVDPLGNFAQVINNWIQEDERIREEILTVADQILEVCPVDEDFFSGYKPQPYYFSEILTGFWKIYQKEFMEINQSIELDVRKKKNEDILYLENLNYSMELLDDDVVLLYSDIVITTSVDGKKEVEYFEKDNPIYDATYDVELKKRKTVEFEDSLVVRAYLIEPEEDFEIRQFEYTYTKDDFVHLE